MSIYSDHIRLWNAGILPDDLTIEKLMGKHTSEPRNPKMAEAFYRAGFIEVWGRGIEKIISGFNSEGLSVPTIEIEQRGVTVTILREKFQAVILGGTTDVEQFKIKQEGLEKTDQKTLIIELLKHDPRINRADLALKLGIHESSVKRRLEALVLDGKIRRVGPDKGGHWDVIDN